MLRGAGDRTLRKKALSKFRIDMISEEIRRETDKIIREDMHDPRLGGTYCITRAEVTRDLRYAKMYVSILEDDKAEGVMAALKSGASFIRRELYAGIAVCAGPQQRIRRARGLPASGDRACRGK